LLIAMTLTWTVLAAVLLGALLHASWNAVIKASYDKELDTAVMHGTGALVALPAALAVGWPAAEAWPYILASVAIHLGYFVTLAGALRHSDLGLAYPLMRGTAPLLVALAATLGLGEALGPWAWAGMLGICVGVRASGNALQYTLALFALSGWPFAALVLARRGRAVMWPYARGRWPFALGGALASMGSYGLALWAMTQAPVATVAALRETSVLFAALLGTWLLKEAFSLQRAVATAAIVAGVVALRMG
jgi:drug/metabolite transporter (DMT)-like permease